MKWGDHNVVAFDGEGGIVALSGCLTEEGGGWHRAAAMEVGRVGPGD